MKRMASRIFVLCCAVAFGENCGAMQVQNPQETATRAPAALSDCLIEAIDSTLCSLLPNDVNNAKDLKYVHNVIKVFRNTSVETENGQSNVIDLINNVNCRFSNPAQNRVLPQLDGILRTITNAGAPVPHMLDNLREAIATITGRNQQGLFRGPDTRTRKNLSELFSSADVICSYSRELSRRDGEVVSYEDVLMKYARTVTLDGFTDPLRDLADDIGYRDISGLIHNAQLSAVNYEAALDEYNKLFSRVDQVNEFSVGQKIIAFFNGGETPKPTKEQLNFLKKLDSARSYLSAVTGRLQNNISDVLRAAFNELSPVIGSNASMRALATSLGVDISDIPSYILPGNSGNMNFSIDLTEQLPEVYPDNSITDDQTIIDERRPLVLQQALCSLVNCNNNDTEKMLKRLHQFLSLDDVNNQYRTGLLAWLNTIMNGGAITYRANVLNSYADAFNIIGDTQNAGSVRSAIPANTGRLEEPINDVMNELIEHFLAQRIINYTRGMQDLYQPVDNAAVLQLLADCDNIADFEELNQLMGELAAGRQIKGVDLQYRAMRMGTPFNAVHIH